MARYYANSEATAGGDHEVHAWWCVSRPQTNNCRDLGEFSHCADAVTEAQKTNPQSKAWIWCFLERCD
jgi:hypothetical protein